MAQGSAQVDATRKEDERKTKSCIAVEKRAVQEGQWIDREL
jgi:hypothetical protein